MAARSSRAAAATRLSSVPTTMQRTCAGIGMRHAAPTAARSTERTRNPLVLRLLRRSAQVPSLPLGRVGGTAGVASRHHRRTLDAAGGAPGELSGGASDAAGDSGGAARAGQHESLCEQPGPAAEAVGAPWGYPVARTWWRTSAAVRAKLSPRVIPDALMETGSSGAPTCMAGTITSAGT